ncbi:MAG: phasin family protein [Rickettsiales bacterium]|nr:phasin family protein [Rickettsiales bacterium]
MTYNYAFTDFFKNNFDFNQMFASQRRDIEAASAINQIAVESAQEISRRNAELARENVEVMLKAGKDMMSGSNPEANISKNAEAARSFFEGTLAHMREMTEMVTKCSFEAYDVMNRRAAEKMEEFSKASSGAAPKKAAK